MDVNYEYIDPFDNKYDYLMRVEHLGRYLFACHLLKNSNNVLDVSCADGYGTYLLSNCVNKVYGIDRNKSYLDIGKAYYNADNIIYKQVDLNDEVIEGKYDNIVCFETLEHLEDPETLLHNLYDVLEDKGTLLLSVPNSKYELDENGVNKDSYHLHVFDYYDLIEMIELAGFKIKEIYGQSYINKIVNKEIDKYELTDLENDSKTIGYPNKEDIDKTYSYIFILNKEVK